MKNKETRLVVAPEGERYKEGYFLTLEELETLCEDHLADRHDGFVSNTMGYIEYWLKKEGPDGYRRENLSTHQRSKSGPARKTNTNISLKWKKLRLITAILFPQTVFRHKTNQK